MGRERIFKIFGKEMYGQGSLNFQAFIRSVEKEINADEETIESAKRANLMFTERLKEVLKNPENDLYTGSMVEYIQRRIPRNYEMKNFEYNGKKYEAEIDLLERTFFLREMHD